MKTTFICLANSKKYNGRCLAGIEINLDQEGKTETIPDLITGQQIITISSGGTDGVTIEPVLVNLKPKWIRPVSRSGYGEVPIEIAKNFSLLDVIEIDITEKCPHGYQCENIYFDKNNIKTQYPRSDFPDESWIELLDDLAENDLNNLFGNFGIAVPAENIDTVKKSLVLIKPENIRLILNNNQLRTKFNFNYHEYNLPITDLEFIGEYEKDNDLLKNRIVYYSISLGEYFNGHHYKLIAGIIYFKKSSSATLVSNPQNALYINPNKPYKCVDCGRPINHRGRCWPCNIKRKKNS